MDPHIPPYRDTYLCLIISHNFIEPDSSICVYLFIADWRNNRASAVTQLRKSLFCKKGWIAYMYSTEVLHPSMSTTWRQFLTLFHGKPCYQSVLSTVILDISLTSLQGPYWTFCYYFIWQFSYISTSGYFFKMWH